MASKGRYALLTVDTEALPKRAAQDHVMRLMWGRHASGTAGVKEMSALGDEVGAKHVFFVDYCGAYNRKDEIDDVVRWLDGAGQDVQLHTHPEYLPQEFWKAHGFNHRPRLMNEYGKEKSDFTIQFFSKLISDVTNKPVLSHRAGSFRWNSNAIEALKKADIPLSFNNSMNAKLIGQCVHSLPTNDAFTWSNGVVEIPVTEQRVLPGLGKEWWARFQFPESKVFKFQIIPWWQYLIPFRQKAPDLLVLLLHSWSLLYWDENGHGEYRDDKRIEGYRKLLHKISRDYDIVTSTELLDLIQRGKVSADRIEDLSLAALKGST